MNAVSPLVLLAALGSAPFAPPLPAGSAVPSPSPSVPASATASPIPSTPATASPVPDASVTAPSALPSVSPAAATPPGPASTTDPAAYKYRFVPRQPDAPVPGVPQIFAVYINDQTLTSQGPINIKVTTSPDVVKVVSQSGSHAGVIPQIVPGDFEAFSKLPKVPFIASGMTLYLEFIATGPTGAKTSVRVPVKLR